MRLNVLTTSKRTDRQTLFQERWLERGFDDIKFFGGHDPSNTPGVEVFGQRGIPMNHAEICIWLSWRAVMQHVLEVGETMLWMEDDALPAPRANASAFPQVQYDWFPMNADFIYLHNREMAARFESGNPHLDIARPCPLGVHGVVITPKGAEKYLKLDRIKQADLCFMEIAYQDGETYMMHQGKELVMHDRESISNVTGAPADEYLTEDVS